MGVIKKHKLDIKAGWINKSDSEPRGVREKLTLESLDRCLLALSDSKNKMFSASKHYCDFEGMQKKIIKIREDMEQKSLTD